MPDEESRNRKLYEVNLTDEAFFSFVALPTKRIFTHVDKDLGLLENTPHLGRKYDPAYEAKRLPFPCRVLYCEHYGIYYRVDEDTQTVLVFAIEDQRRNPLGRFSSYEYAVISLEEPSANGDENNSDKS